MVRGPESYLHIGLEKTLPSIELGARDDRSRGVLAPWALAELMQCNRLYGPMDWQITQAPRGQARDADVNIQRILF